MAKDKIFDNPKHPVPPFEFNKEVAEVFDDMIFRSVPLYHEILNRQTQFIQGFYQSQTKIYDLGCSTGNLGMNLCEKMQTAFEIVAVDNSQPMLDVFKDRLDRMEVLKPYQRFDIEWVCQSIDKIEVADASVVVLNFTLQFLPLERRERLLATIFKGLVPGGILLFSEKVTHSIPMVSKVQQDFYYRFKKENGYSELEISQKREALENVLIPETIEIHQQRLKKSGFIKQDIWLKWFNFMSMVGFK